jgi:pimeloyl-ACP methyl ester carboxylesterase
MGKINLGRVLMGGLLAGLIINIGEFILNGVLLAEEMNATMAALNKPPISPEMIVWFVAFGFGLGFMLVWVYAAIRPRLGAGIKTAICASAVVWGLSYLYPNLFMIIIGLFPRDMMVIAIVWGFVELIIAGIAGAWLYTETTAIIATEPL